MPTSAHTGVLLACGVEKHRLFGVASGCPRRLSTGELGDSLGALRHGVLGQLAGQNEAHGGLDLPGGHGGLLVVPGQGGGLGGDLLEDVVDEAVQDGHGLGRDAGVGVDLLQHLVDVDLVGLRLAGRLPGLAGALGRDLLGGLLLCLGSHCA